LRLGRCPPARLIPQRDGPDGKLLADPHHTWMAIRTVTPGMSRPLHGGLGSHRRDDPLRSSLDGATWQAWMVPSPACLTPFIAWLAAAGRPTSRLGRLGDGMDSDVLHVTSPAECLGRPPADCPGLRPGWRNADVDGATSAAHALQAGPVPIATRTVALDGAPPGTSLALHGAWADGCWLPRTSTWRTWMVAWPVA
jgi:hypothetical protein